jgi:hypothetical protein
MPFSTISITVPVVLRPFVSVMIAVVNMALMPGRRRE